LRRSEVLGLRYASIDFDDNTVAINHTVVKTDKLTYYTDSTKNDSSNDVLPLPKELKTHFEKMEGAAGAKQIAPAQRLR
jgi:integrase